MELWEMVVGQRCWGRFPIDVGRGIPTVPGKLTAVSYLRGEWCAVEWVPMTMLETEALHVRIRGEKRRR